MASSQLPNYLKSHRKRLALSQDEVAFLLGIQSGAKVCRNERFMSEPSLETALAYVAIFKSPASELFGGLYQKIEKQVAERAGSLVGRMDAQLSNQRVAHKRKALTDIIAAQSN